QLLPAAVLDPSSDGRVAEEELDLAEIFKLGYRRVDAHELDREPVFLQEVAHRVLVECESRTAPRLFPVVPMVCREDERASRPQGPTRVPDDFRGHAQVADHRVDGLSREVMVWQLLDIAQDEFRVSDR